MQAEAIKKIVDSMQDCKEQRIPAEPIMRYLTGKCGEGDEFCALVIQEHKTLEKCFNFVYEQARKHLNNASNGWIEDNDVYMMAEDYFSLDDAEIERQKAEEEAKLAEERAKRDEEYKQRIADRANTLEKKEDQLSLFDEGE